MAARSTGARTAVTRRRVSSTTFCGSTLTPNRRLPASAISARRRSRPPAVEIVAEVPTHTRSSRPEALPQPSHQHRYIRPLPAAIDVEFIGDEEAQLTGGLVQHVAIPRTQQHVLEHYVVG